MSTTPTPIDPARLATRTDAVRAAADALRTVSLNAKSAGATMAYVLADRPGADPARLCDLRDLMYTRRDLTTEPLPPPRSRV